MSYIEPGSLLVTHSGVKYIATSRDYSRTFTGGGEYMEDWKVCGVVDVVVPETGRAAWIRLSDVAHVSKKS